MKEPVTIRQMWTDKFSNLHDEDNFAAELAFYQGAKAVTSLLERGISSLSDVTKETTNLADITLILHNLPANTVFTIESIDELSGTCSLSFNKNNKNFICRLVPLDAIRKAISTDVS